MTVIKIIEALFVGVLLIFTLVIWRRSFTHNFKLLIFRLLRLLLTYVAGYFAFRWAMGRAYGPIVSGLIATVTGFASLFILGFILKPSADDDDEKRSLPNKFFQRFGNLFLIALLWGIAAIGVDMAATLIEQSRWRSEVYHNSYLLGHVMDWHETTAAESDAEPSNPLLVKLQKTRAWLYDKTGFGHLIDQIDAMSQIQQMAPEQRSALMNQDENLKKLLENPDMLKVIHSEEIRGLFSKAGAGDASALMQLSQNPDINKLFSDPELYKMILSINPRKIVQQQQQMQDSGQ